MGKIISFRHKTYVEYEISELICLKCKKRWIGVFPTTLLLKDIECTCGEKGYVIKTGQSLDI
jgi:hypothetical protein